jgi:hypothetical protein
VTGALGEFRRAPQDLTATTLTSGLREAEPRIGHVTRLRRGAALVSLLLALAPSATARASSDPGRLPQTRVEPPLASLTARLTPLWNALVANDAAAARASFFPRRAYLRMKTGVIADPSADYARRLLGLFDLDVAAYSARIDAGGTPTLLRVSARAGDAAWIPPGACENSIGYWHLPGVRLVYRHGTRVYSVAVFSLISWRGVWYVVHLGPNPRARDVGTLDDFRAGPGTPGPPGGC